MHPICRIKLVSLSRQSPRPCTTREGRVKGFGFRKGVCYTSKMLRFTKMNGAGNDFVLIDNRAGEVKLTARQITRICDRHRGVGADGVLLVEPAANGADFRKRYYNSDGGE